MATNMVSLPVTDHRVEFGCESPSLAGILDNVNCNEILSALDHHQPAQDVSCEDIRDHPETSDSDNNQDSLGRPCSPDDSNSTVAELKVLSWIPEMLACQFFCICPKHDESKKNECTYWCVDCGAGGRATGLCPHCVQAHRGHAVIQIRRYVYCDVVRVIDIHRYLDTSGVQSYVINSAKVVFLRPRTQTKKNHRHDLDCCQSCNRQLREGCRFCSLGCKVEWINNGCKSPPASPYREEKLDKRLSSIKLAGSPGKRPHSAIGPDMGRLRMQTGQGLGLNACVESLRKHIRKQHMPQRSPAF
ncbi:hypothetical protein WJX73_000216 [Symbiochloris irregularis]|uniref:Uncharacterized protein n=1 Tax=Symbiochloris irregularis TaxID=706552 RepID=A0AAW1NSP6_9CHLO